MDPLTQGALGASLPQSFCDKKQLALAGLFGFLAGMAADLDVLIFSRSDPLLFLEYHRQFTHALVFIPIGGAICGWLLYQLLGKRRGLSLRQSIMYATLGYATHALLDACTSYGTQLLWPFSDARIAWNNISVIDPLYTLPLLTLVIVSARKNKPLFARIALSWALIYPVIGLLQHDRAIDAGKTLASNRGHQPIRLEAKPSFANLLLWKTIYETEDRYYVDAVRVGGKIKYYPGQHLEKLDVERDLSWLDPQSQQARDIERFRWFSNGYIARDPDNNFRIIDIRYSIIPNEIKALWSIELSPSAEFNDHAQYIVDRTSSNNSRQALSRMLFD